MLTISEQIKKLRDLAELCASTSDHMMAKYLNDAADTIERLLKSYMDIKAEIENNSFTNRDGTEVVDCLVVYMTISKYLDKIMNEYTKG